MIALEAGIPSLEKFVLPALGVVLLSLYKFADFVIITALLTCILPSIYDYLYKSNTYFES